MNVMIIFGAAIIFIGIYLIVQAVKMKNSKELIGNPILAEEDARKCKDKTGFITYIFGREVAAGIAVIILGVALVAKELFAGAAMIANIVIVLTLLVVLFFLYALGEARKKYLY